MGAPIEGNSLYDYWPRPGRPDLSWPGGKKIAAYVGVNIEHWHLGMPGVSIIPSTAALPVDPGNFGWRDYGSRVGVWRLAELLDRLDWPATVLLNSDVCDSYPEVIEAGVERNWAWLGHGIHSSMVWTGMDEEEERAALTGMVQKIEAATGSRPRGWLGPALTETANTPRLLAELGATYLLDWCNDDQPFPLNVGSDPMISIPYSIEVNDISVFVGRGESGQGFERIILDQLEVLVEEARRGSGSVMAIGLHPYLSNHPFRHKYLANALEAVRECDEVWATTADEIDAWYREHHLMAARESLRGRSGSGTG